MQESRPPGAATVLDCALYLGIAIGQIQTVGKEIIEIRAILEIDRDPVGGRFHRDADAVVLADEQHRRRQFLMSRPRRRVERGLRNRMVARGIAERTNGNAVLGDRQPMADAPRLLDRNRGAERLGQVRGDGRSLRQHPQWLGAPHLVAAAGGRIVLAGGEAQRRIDDRIHSGQLAETLGHEGAGAVVQKRRIGMPRQPRHHRVALMAAGADGVEHLVLHTQHACHQVEMPRGYLGFEQLAKAPGIQSAARQHRLIVLRRGMHRAPPQLYEFEEILIDDLGTVEPFVAGTDGGR